MGHLEDGSGHDNYICGSGSTVVRDEPLDTRHEGGGGSPDRAKDRVIGASLRTSVILFLILLEGERHVLSRCEVIWGFGEHNLFVAVSEEDTQKVNGLCFASWQRRTQQ